MAKVLIPGTDITDHVNDNGKITSFDLECTAVEIHWHTRRLNDESVEFEMDLIPDLELDLPDVVDREEFDNLNERFLELEEKHLKALAELCGHEYRIKEQALIIIKQGKQLLKQSKPWWRIW